jgi:hypothetical protein
MPTRIYFGGRSIGVPGVYSKVDASALSSVSPSAVGIVALIGTAEGGKPLTVASADSDATQAGTLKERYKSGDLKTAGLFCFEPSLDEAVPGGAQREVLVKVNPATQSTATLDDDGANDSVDLTSSDYGLFTTQVNIDVADGTTQGKLITIVFEDQTETFDDVGGDSVFSVLYAPGAQGWDTISGAVTSAGFVVDPITGTDTGLSAERAADIPAPGFVRVESSDVGDTTQTVTIYGLSATNVPISETLSLNGTTEVTGTTSFTKVTACRKSAATVGTVTVEDTVLPTTLFTLAPATLTRGLVDATNRPCGNVLTVSIDVDTAVDVVVRGENNGTAVSERFDMTTGNTTPVVGVVNFTKVTAIELGDVAGARTITVDTDMTVAVGSYTTVQKVVDFLNAQDGMTATALVSNPTTFAMTDMDFDAAQSLLTTAKDFYADLYEFVAKINESSQYIDAARATGASLVPANTTSPVFLTGGVEGSPTITEWQSALDLLKTRRVTTIVPLTQDPAVHAALASHLVLRGGALRSEANGYVGIGTVGGAGETRANIKAQTQALGTRHLSAISQEVERFDPDTGEATWYPPHFFCAIAAGMQAGSPIGEPLTRKTILATDVRNDSSWSVSDDVEELLDAGLMMAEKVDGVGVRWVRSLTTHLADDNVAFVEMSANESANTAAYELRRRIELKIGKRGLGGSVAGIKGLASDELGQLVDDEIIVAWRALQVEQVGDVFPMSVELAPVLPINFVPITIHLVAAQVAA